MTGLAKPMEPGTGLLSLGVGEEGGTLKCPLKVALHQGELNTHEKGPVIRKSGQRIVRGLGAEKDLRLDFGLKDIAENLPHG